MALPAAFFDAKTQKGILDWFGKDKFDNRRGLVKIYLQDIDKYD